MFKDVKFGKRGKFARDLSLQCAMDRVVRLGSFSSMNALSTG
jgi:hypothetical protein